MRYICGNDGSELRCCKTGLKIKDHNYSLREERFAADMYFCPVCNSITIMRNERSYLDPSNHEPDALIGVNNCFIHYSDELKAKLVKHYNLELPETEF